MFSGRCRNVSLGFGSFRSLRNMLLFEGIKHSEDTFLTFLDLKVFYSTNDTNFAYDCIFAAFTVA